MTSPTATRRRRRKVYDEEQPAPPPINTADIGLTTNKPVPPEALTASEAWQTPAAGQVAPTSAPAAPISDREAARKRAAEIMEHGLAVEEGNDKFEFDRSIIPDGWDYAWKRLTVYGQEDPAYQVQLSRNGWEPVPAKRHPEMMPHDWKHATITRDGQILMMRPMEITERSRLIEKRNALNQVRVKELQLGSAPNGTFERGTHPGAPVLVKKAYEPAMIPTDR
jgi:hypothetical protein